MDISFRIWAKTGTPFALKGHMKTLIAAFLGLTLTFFAYGDIPCSESVRPFSLSEIRPHLDSISIAGGEAQWTVDDAYEGNIVIFQARGHAHKNGNFYVAKVDIDAQWGDDGSEYQYIHVAPISYEKVKELEAGGKLQLAGFGIQSGKIQMSRDLPLNQDLYAEFEPVSLYGTIGWRPKIAPDFELLAKLEASIGYAIARPVSGDVNETSNFYPGKQIGLTARHRRFGAVDFSYEVDGEQQKYNDERVSSREARVRLAYTYDINDRSSFIASAEKRSFSFGPDYEKGKRYVFTYQRKFK